MPMVITGFVRQVTNRLAFVDPDSVEDAIAFIYAVLESPGVDLAACGQAWLLLRNKLLTFGLQGNLVTDAWHIDLYELAIRPFFNRLSS